MIQAVKNGQYSAEQVALHFGIPNSGIISQWLCTFDKQGINGLSQTKRSSNDETQIPENTPPPKTEEERLRYRILELEAENAILKKLQELNQAKMQKKPIS